MSSAELANLIKQFPWISFYMEFADKLRQHKSDRSELIEFIHKDQRTSKHFNYLRDRDQNNIKCDLDDICPFTTIGTFNRGILGKTAKIETKQEIAYKLASFLGVKTPVPGSFDGIPTLDNQNSWFFSFSYDKHGNLSRKPDDIDTLWKIFDGAIEYADNGGNVNDFINALNTAILYIKYAGPRYLPIGLFWIRPADFLPLDTNSEIYLSSNFDGISIDAPIEKNLRAEQYLNIVKKLKTIFKEDASPVASFPELALRAVDSEIQPAVITTNPPEREKPMDTNAPHPLNQILYGPPGTGKTYNTISRAVAIATGIDLSYWEDEDNADERFEKFNELKQNGQIQMVTFHQNYAYEDFIEGIKPVLGGGDVSYEMQDGIFKKIANTARNNPEQNYVLIIDEINRGNISKIFGELITLIEDTKRQGEVEGIELTLPYSKEKFGVPNNLYIIGTMNTADRSIASLDIALRRRFRFIEMMPDTSLLNEIENDAISLPELLTAINQRISELHDSEHQIGHSYLMNVENINGLKSVFQHDIIPLLQEYFFNDKGKIKEVLDGSGFITERETNSGTIYDVLPFGDKKWDTISNYTAIYKGNNDTNAKNG